MVEAQPKPGRPVRYVAGLPQPDRCLVMGVVNVTPDSFSDGGLWLEPTDAIAHGLQLAAAGADFVDVGGESTRPGAARPPIEVELRRVLPVVRELVAAGLIVSIDTMRAAVAAQAIEAGAAAVNDVSGGRADDDMLRVMAEADVPVILMHWRGHSDRMQDLAVYDDVVSEVRAELRPQIDAAVAAGVSPNRIAIDPGFGFAKTGEHNWTMLQRFGELVADEFPILVGVSRKSFLMRLLADNETGERRPAAQCDAATAALSTITALAGGWCVRTHEVAANLDAVRVAARLGHP